MARQNYGGIVTYVLLSVLFFEIRMGCGFLALRADELVLMGACAGSPPGSTAHFEDERLGVEVFKLLRLGICNEILIADEEAPGELVSAGKIALS